MKKIRLFSANVTKGIEGEEAELHVDFYLVLNRNYIFTFLIDAPNLMCSDRHPIRLWKHFLMMLEEENVKYMRRYENMISKREQGITSKEEEALNIWAHSKGVIEVLTSYPMGAWLHQRDKRLVGEILDKIRAEINKQKDNVIPCIAYPADVYADGKIDAYNRCLRIIDKYKAESEDKE